MILIDTNLFLEIMLNQEKKDVCKNFLEENAGELYVTDFSLHSIGVICFKYREEESFGKFLKDILPNVECVVLPLNEYYEVIKNRKKLNLDFDDAYQYTVAKYFNLAIATMDKDFKKVDDVEVLFL